MAQPARFIYLHGFASSPSSRKAHFFLEKFSQKRIFLHALDLAPDFSSVTVTSQLRILEDALCGAPAILIGSSMGGYLASLYAARHPEVERLLLLAPAFDFHRLWVSELGPEKLAAWRKNGSISVFHYGRGVEVPLGYQLIEDAQQYEPFPDFSQPCLILHGRKDSVVPLERSERMAASHANVTLIPFNSGHELTDVLDEIWKASCAFLWGAASNQL